MYTQRKTPNDLRWSLVTAVQFIMNTCANITSLYNSIHHFQGALFLLRNPADLSDLAGMQDGTFDKRLEETDLIIRMTSSETKRLNIYCINSVSNNLNKTADSFVGWTEQDFFFFLLPKCHCDNNLLLC